MHNRFNMLEYINTVPLADHHCHGVVEQELTRPEFEMMITESNWLPVKASVFDTQLGLAVRSLCAPALGLPKHIEPDTYLQMRNTIQPHEVNERLLRASGISQLFVETGFRGSEILSPEQMAKRAGATAHTVVRLEKIAEDLALTDVTAANYAAAFRQELAQQLTGAVGVKTIAAYRIGLDFTPYEPTAAEVQVAAAAWLEEVRATGNARLADEVLIRFGIWCAVHLQQPIQFHVGFGDPDVDLHRCNPLLLTDWLRLTRQSQARAMLLHCYPFQREAGYLAHSFPHVYCDVGLAINYVGAMSEQIIAESLELTPFDKLLFSSDAWGLAELYYLGAKLFRQGTAKVFAQMISAEFLTVAEAQRLIRKICYENAAAAYQLPAVAVSEQEIR